MGFIIHTDKGGILASRKPRSVKIIWIWYDTVRVGKSEFNAFVSSWLETKSGTSETDRQYHNNYNFRMIKCSAYLCKLLPPNSLIYPSLFVQCIFSSGVAYPTCHLPIFNLFFFYFFTILTFEKLRAILKWHYVSFFY